MSVPVLSWLLTACRTAIAGKAGPIHRRSLPSPAMPLTRHGQSRTRLPASSPSVNRVLDSPPKASKSLAAARQTQPLEPILFPKLRIYFADFPYLHCSIDQRLLTLETCCGYGYDRTRSLLSPWDFQGPSGRQGTPQEARCFTRH